MCVHVHVCVCEVLALPPGDFAMSRYRSQLLFVLWEVKNNNNNKKMPGFLILPAMSGAST